MDRADAPPSAPLDDAPVDVEEIRRAHVQREAAIRFVGAMFWLFGALGVFRAVVRAMGISMYLLSGDLDPGQLPKEGLKLALFGGVGGMMLWLGPGLRRFEPKVRVPTMWFSAVSLFAFPFGTVAGAYVLYLLGTEEGERVMADDYAEIVRKTPGVSVPTPAAAWGCLALLVLLAVVVALGQLND